MTRDTRRSRRATQIFEFEAARPDSPIAARVWRTRSEPVESFTSVATTHWEMVVAKHRGRTTLTVRGPETRATVVLIPQDAEFFGIEFRLGTLMPGLPAARLVDAAVVLPGAGRRSFWLDGSAWEFPTLDNVDVFLKRLVRKGIVVRDPIVEDALRGRRTDVSSRSIQRRMRRATGLTHAFMRRIERARQSVVLLDGGTPILEVVERAGYADQPHLTRELTWFIGHTPARIVRDQSK